MPIQPYGWLNESNPLGPPANPATATAISAAHLEAMLGQAGAYADSKSAISVTEPPYNASPLSSDNTAAINAAEAAAATAGRALYFPGGTYTCTGRLSLGAGYRHWIGDDYNETRLVFSTDGGTRGSVHAINTSTASGFNATDIGFQGPAAVTTFGAVNANLSCLKTKPSSIFTRCVFANFYGGISIASNHEKFFACYMTNNYYCTHFISPSLGDGTKGNQGFYGCQMPGASKACIGVANDNDLDGVFMVDTHHSYAPYWVFGESGRNGGVFMNGSHFIKCAAEDMGNGWFWDSDQSGVTANILLEECDCSAFEAFPNIASEPNDYSCKLGSVINMTIRGSQSTFAFPAMGSGGASAPNGGYMAVTAANNLQWEDAHYVIDNLTIQAPTGWSVQPQPTGGSFTGGALSSSLSTGGGAITSLPVSALGAAIPAGVVQTQAPLTSPGTLTATLSTSVAISSLPVSALSANVAAGMVQVTASGHSQWWNTAGATAGATSITVTPQVPNFAYPSSTQVVPIQTQNWTTTGAASSATSVPVTSQVPNFNYPGTTTNVSPMVYWRMSSLNATGESMGSIEKSAAVPPGGSAVATYFTVAGATSYKGYRGTSANAQGQAGQSGSFQVFSGNGTPVTGVGTQWTDAGSAPASGWAKMMNTTTSKCLVQITNSQGYVIRSGGTYRGERFAFSQSNLAGAVGQYDGVATWQFTPDPGTGGTLFKRIHVKTTGANVPINGIALAGDQNTTGNVIPIGLLGSIFPVVTLAADGVIPNLSYIKPDSTAGRVVLGSGPSDGSPVGISSGQSYGNLIPVRLGI